MQELVEVPANDWAKREALRRLIREAGDITNAIVFCNRKRDVDVVAKSLQKHGFNASPLHGDLDQSLRTKTLDGFRAGTIQLLVASDVAARGLDIPAVSQVFNFDVPYHPDDYVHRIGRTGRAGRIGHTYMLVTPRDGKQVDAIEKLTKTTIPRRVMADLEVREDASRGARKSARAGAAAARTATAATAATSSGPRNITTTSRRWSRRRVADAPVAAAPTPAPVEQPVARASEPARHHDKPRQESRPEKKHEPRRDNQQHAQPKQQRERTHKAHQDRKNDATPVKPEKHELRPSCSAP